MSLFKRVGGLVAKLREFLRYEFTIRRHEDKIPASDGDRSSRAVRTGSNSPYHYKNTFLGRW